MPKFLLPLIAAGLSLATAATAQAAETRSTPGWLRADPASKTVEMDVVSGFNENNNVWNFNGFHTGDATILVPLGWEVRMLFSNKDDAVPHSLVVIADPGEERSTRWRRAKRRRPYTGRTAASRWRGSRPTSRPTRWRSRPRRPATT